MFLWYTPGVWLVQALAVQKAAEKVAESKAKELAYIRQVRPWPGAQGQGRAGRAQVPGRRGELRARTEC